MEGIASPDLINVLAAVCIGVLIGAVTGAVTLMLLVKGFSGSVSIKDLSVISSETLALPAFWFGGSWISKQALGDIQFSAYFGYYIISLAIVYLAFCVYSIRQISLTLSGAGKKETRA